MFCNFYQPKKVGKKKNVAEKDEISMPNLQFFNNLFILFATLDNFWSIHSSYSWLKESLKPALLLL